MLSLPGLGLGLGLGSTRQLLPYRYTLTPTLTLALTLAFTLAPTLTRFRGVKRALEGDTQRVWPLETRHSRANPNPNPNAGGCDRRTTSPAPCSYWRACRTSLRTRSLWGSACACSILIPPTFLHPGTAEASRTGGRRRRRYDRNHPWHSDEPSALGDRPRRAG